MGHFLVEVGAVNEKTFRRYEKESREKGKASFAYAWVLDQNEDEVRADCASLQPVSWSRCV